MEVAILCPGPSLNAYLAHPVAHEMVLGVNAAATAHPCDWWVCVDAAPFRWWEPMAWPDGRKPKRLTSWTAHQGLRDEGRLGDAEWLLCEQVPTDCKRDPPWTNYSMTAAMVLADHLGANRIAIYGCDWKGAEYFNGKGPGLDANFSEYRWKNEMWVHGHVEGWLKAHGVEVERK